MKKKKEKSYKYTFYLPTYLPAAATSATRKNSKKKIPEEVLTQRREANGESESPAPGRRPGAINIIHRM